MEEFILLFTALDKIQLNTEKDVISRRWNRHGEYSASSAYDIQFLGAYPQFKASTISQAQTEPKCRFFPWLATLNKAPMPGNLERKN
jgi:hypothetical protein